MERFRKGISQQASHNRYEKIKYYTIGWHDGFCATVVRIIFTQTLTLTPWSYSPFLSFYLTLAFAIVWVTTCFAVDYSSTRTTILSFSEEQENVIDVTCPFDICSLYWGRSRCERGSSFVFDYVWEPFGRWHSDTVVHHRESISRFGTRRPASCQITASRYQIRTEYDRVRVLPVRFLHYFRQSTHSRPSDWCSRSGWLWHCCPISCSTQFHPSVTASERWSCSRALCCG